MSVRLLDSQTPASKLSGLITGISMAQSTPDDMHSSHETTWRLGSYGICVKAVVSQLCIGSLLVMTGEKGV